MIEIDGSKGEGGGQVLRSALSLSVATGQPFRIIRIRARRPKPGLAAQHLAAVRAAAQVGQAEVMGARMGSARIVFRPQRIQPGEYRWDIGTAGSTALVLQTVFTPLSLAQAPSQVSITGGTHVKWSPCYQYLEWHWLTFMRRMGFDADLNLERAGYYPRGGGEIRARIRPAGRQATEPNGPPGRTPAAATPLNLTDRGRLLQIRGLSAVSNLPGSIAERQRRQAMSRLHRSGLDCPIDILVERMPARGKGTLLLLLAEFEHSQACSFGLGELGVPAERVADGAVDATLAMLDSGAAIDEYLTDQLLLPLAFASGPSELRTAGVTQHLLTNAQVIRAFGAAKVEIEGELGELGLVRVMPSMG